MSRSLLAAIAAILALSLLAGCGDDGGTTGDVTRPTVAHTSPTAEATDVNLNPVIEIGFSSAMDEASLATITGTGISVHHAELDSSGMVATVYLGEPLEPETAYSLTVPTTVRNTAGHGLAAGFTLNFTTGPFDCDHLNDYLESTEEYWTPVPVELDRYCPLLSSCGGDERWDYFIFTVTNTAKVTMRVSRHGDGPPVGWYTGFQGTNRRGLDSRPIGNGVGKGHTQFDGGDSGFLQPQNDVSRGRPTRQQEGSSAD